MRKLTRILLATAILMLMLTLCCFGASALETTHEHEWVPDVNYNYDFNCEYGGYCYLRCAICGNGKSEYRNPAEHKPVDCEVPNPSTFCGTQTIYASRCNVCGKPIAETTLEGTKEHDWCIDEMMSSFSDCTQGGELRYYCRDCYEEKYVTVEPKEHTIYWTSNNDATCTKDGTKSPNCSECYFFDWGPIKETVIDEGSALGHDHSGDWTVLLPATCSDRGVQITTCTRCSDIKSEVLPATGHTDNNSDNICDECNAKLSDTTVPDDSNPDDGTTDTPETPDEPTEPEEPKREANVFSFLTEFLNNIIDFFKKLFKL